jgi:hypothetical protein
MIIKLGEGFGGVFGGKRGILRLNLNVSLPLRIRLHISTTPYLAASCGVIKYMV